MTPSIYAIGDQRQSDKVFASHERVSGFSEKGADLPESPGNFWESPGNFRRSPELLLQLQQEFLHPLKNAFGIYLIYITLNIKLKMFWEFIS